MMRNDEDKALEKKPNPATEDGRDRSGLDDRDDEGEPGVASTTVSTPAGRAYEGDHKNHGEPDVDAADDDGLEEVSLDELPDAAGPDA